MQILPPAPGQMISATFIAGTYKYYTCHHTVAVMLFLCRYAVAMRGSLRQLEQVTKSTRTGPKVRESIVRISQTVYRHVYRRFTITSEID